MITVPLVKRSPGPSFLEICSLLTAGSQIVVRGEVETVLHVLENTLD